MKKMKVLYFLGVGLISFLACAGAIYAASSHDVTSLLGGASGDFFNLQGTMLFDSIKVGRQGTGGVTFFNGTIVNNTTKNGVDNPVTFGDDVRIDGVIYRTEQGGNYPLKVGDTIIPSEDNIYSLGTSDYHFKDGYIAGTLTVGTLMASSLSGSGIISSDNLADNAITTAKIAYGAVTEPDLSDGAVTSNKIANGAVGMFDVDPTATFNIAGLSLTDHASQDSSHEGILKAWANIDYTGFISDSWNVQESTQTALGQYEIKFYFDVAEIVNGHTLARRAIIATPSSYTSGLEPRLIGVEPKEGTTDTVLINVFDHDGNLAESSFMIAVY